MYPGACMTPSTDRYSTTTTSLILEPPSRPAGADVAITSRKLDTCKEVATEVEATTGRRLQPGLPRRPLGRGRRAGRRHLRRVRPGRRAGQQRRHVAALPDLVSVTEDLFDKVIGVNLKGPFRLAALVGAGWPRATAARSST